MKHYNWDDDQEELEAIIGEITGWERIDGLTANWVPTLAQILYGVNTRQTRKKIKILLKRMAIEITF